MNLDFWRNATNQEAATICADAYPNTGKHAENYLALLFDNEAMKEQNHFKPGDAQSNVYNDISCHFHDAQDDHNIALDIINNVMIVKV
ncbi:UNVERIFIED_ORG: hypothetical protein M2402_003767 [Rahnella aquatilis]